LILFASLAINSQEFVNFELGSPNHSIETRYGPETNIRGWVNLSFDEIGSESKFRDNLNREINISEILKSNPSYLYSCNSVDCKDNYALS